ncbi:MAG: hypothetical protein M3041_09820 [Acidobacteriota bacterium]|nr:hypothetical protein [Acidobacteriota bacterium]
MLQSILLITALSIPTNTLVLRTGERIVVDEPVRVDGAQVLFRSGGALFTIPTIDVDFDASRSEERAASVRTEARGKLRVSREERDRLLRELEENHSGTAVARSPVNVPGSPTVYERRVMNDDEWSWRHQARSYEEEIRRSQEDLNLLLNKAESLKAHIAGLLSLGFKPSQFTYDSTQLAYTLEQIPRAELEVQRSQRGYDQFRDDARKQGVTPGWLR